jgi:hypothetical protein
MDPGFFAIIDALVAARKGDIAAISRPLGAVARRDEAGSNGYFAVWTLTPGVSGLTRSEARLSVTPGRALIIVGVDAKTRCVARRDVWARYGRPTRLEPPSPHGPAGSRGYDVFQRPWGKLSVGVGAGECVTNLVIDAAS